jgi:hypothetical protein
MLKAGAQPPFPRRLVARLLALTLLCQPAIPFARVAAWQPDPGLRLSGRVPRPDVSAADAPFKTDGASPAGPAAGGDAGHAPQDGSCPAAASGREATTLIYLGQTQGHCGEPLPVSARLADACGNALAGRQLDFTVGTRTVSATTDANGVASTSLVPPGGSGQIPLTVNFAGDDNSPAARDSASVMVARANTYIRYTGKRLLAAGATEPVSATLMDAANRRPIPNAVLNFEVGSAKVSATTDANGVAAANITLPAGETFERSQLKVNFAGDACHSPAIAADEVTAYLQTAFVIWGGNNERLSLGRRVNFWGHSWAKQVSAGDYKAHNDFKGYADTVRQFQLCQVNVRTTSTPPLDDSSPPTSELLPEMSEEELKRFGLDTRDDLIISLIPRPRPGPSRSKSSMPSEPPSPIGSSAPSTKGSSPHPEKAAEE